jgi:8-oxo-dGTP pyrophosphatase MutT (NUDIX family)
VRTAGFAGCGAAGGKVAAGESDAAALARELHEELGVKVTVGPRIGADVALNETTTLRVTRHADRRRCTPTITVHCGGSAPTSSTAWPGPADRACR